MNNTKIKKIMINNFYILTQESSYWLGFLAADGWLSNNKTNKNQIGLCLKLDDIEHIEKFKKYMNTSNKIGIYKNSANIRFTSKEIFNSLIECGLCEKKSHSEISLIEKIPNEFKKNWICGFFDGDGSIFKYQQKDKEYLRVHLCGNENTMLEVIEYLQKNFNFSKLKIHKNGSIWRLALSSVNDVMEFYNIYNKSPVKLNRKLNTFKNTIHILNNKKQRIIKK